MKSLSCLVATAYLLTAVLPEAHATASEIELKSGDRVVLLGGTFVERLQAYGFAEAALAAGYADRDVTFRNLGWSGDNVFGEARALFGAVDDGFQRLEKDLRDARPTVVVVNYGGNEAHAGTAGLALFQKGLERLLDTVASTKARVIVLLPHAYEDLGGNLPSPEVYNQNLEIYRGALRDASQRRKLAVIDLAELMRTARRDLPPGQLMTDNGVHLSPRGYRLLGPHFARALGARRRRWQVDLDAADNTLEAVGCVLQQLSTTTRDGATVGIQFTVVDDVVELSQRSGFGSPTALGLGIMRVRGLAPGDYLLRIDGQPIRNDSAAAWQQGISLTQRGGQEQAEQLRQAVVAKNQLYFHRYRPQNETYLFLFRKHEQGNNAVEIPQFDPLVESQEERIAALRQPQPRKFELHRAQP